MVDAQIAVFGMGQTIRCGYCSRTRARRLPQTYTAFAGAAGMPVQRKQRKTEKPSRLVE